MARRSLMRALLAAPVFHLVTVLASTVDAQAPVCSGLTLRSKVLSSPRALLPLAPRRLWA